MWRKAKQLRSKLDDEAQSLHCIISTSNVAKEQEDSESQESDKLLDRSQKKCHRHALELLIHFELRQDIFHVKVLASNGQH